MSYELMFQRAVSLHQNGALNEAEKLYRQILETAPDNADVLNLLGLIAQSRGIHSEAVNYFYKAADSAPKHFPVFFNLAVSLAALGKYVESAEAYEKVISLKPDLKEAYYGLANVFWQQNKQNDAAEMFRKALAAANGEYPEAAAGLAELTDDEETLTELCRKYPEFAMPYFYLGRRRLLQNRYPEAEELLRHADGSLSSDEIKTLLGETLLKQKRKDDALPYFYQAVNINRHNFSSLLHIADLEAEKQNFTDAEAFYKKALEVNDKSVSAHTNYANLLCKCKRTLEALEEYRAAVILAPQTPELSYNLAVILKTLGEYEQALALMFNAYYRDSRPEWSLSLAETLILFHQTEPEKAQKIVSNWLEKMPDSLVAKHLQSVFNGETPADEIAYNRLLFDNFADTYENTLHTINYAVINRMAEICPPFKGEVWDLGCGTGLVGERFKTAENTFTGIDLSAEMLKKARAKNIYTNLCQSEIIAYLEQHKNENATLTAADVFCYFGDLSRLFSLCAPRKLIFSLETDLQTETYAVQANGRYKHNPLYVRKQLQNAGYTNINEHSLILRRENGSDVAGLLICASV